MRKLQSVELQIVRDQDKVTLMAKDVASGLVVFTCPLTHAQFGRVVTCWSAVYTSGSVAESPKVGMRRLSQMAQVYVPRRIFQLLQADVEGRLTFNQVSEVGNWWNSGPYAEWDIPNPKDLVHKDAIVKIEEDGYWVRAFMVRWEDPVS